MFSSQGQFCYFTIDIAIIISNALRNKHLPTTQYIYMLSLRPNV